MKKNYPFNPFQWLYLFFFHSNTPPRGFRPKPGSHEDLDSNGPTWSHGNLDPNGPTCSDRWIDGALDRCVSPFLFRMDLLEPKTGCFFPRCKRQLKLGYPHTGCEATCYFSRSSKIQVAMHHRKGALKVPITNKLPLLDKNFSSNMPRCLFPNDLLWQGTP